MTVSYSSIQMVEKISEKPDKVKDLITTDAACMHQLYLREGWCRYPGVLSRDLASGG